MNIKDLKAKDNFDIIEGTIEEIGEVREFNKFGKAGRVSNAIIKDSTGSVKLTLWNEQIDLFNKGDTAIVTNGWTNEWQGELSISAGRGGTVTKKE